MQQNSSETVTNEKEKEIPIWRYVSPEQIKKILDSLGINIIV